MKIFAIGSSLVSSYWNGAATYYRGIYKALHSLGHDITFAEPDIYDRQNKRDLEDVSEEVRKTMKFVFVDDVKSVFNEALMHTASKKEPKTKKAPPAVKGRAGKPKPLSVS